MLNTFSLVVIRRTKMFRIYNNYISGITILLIGTEVLILVAIFYLGITIRYPDMTFGYYLLTNHFTEASTFTLIMILSMAAIGMYKLETRPNIEAILIRLMLSLMLSFGFMTLIFLFVTRPVFWSWLFGYSNVSCSTHAPFYALRLSQVA